MKKIFTLLAAVLMTANVLAQAPQTMGYQAVIRNSSNSLVASTQVRMQISILQGSSSGTPVYVETQTPTTNTNGLVSFGIGSGTVVSGTFSTIDWSAGPYFIKTETDPAGGTSYSITGMSQLMSVPFALYAANSGSAGVPYTGATASVDLGAHDLTLNGMTIGLGSGQAITNTASGRQALYANNTGIENTAIGANTILFNTTGSDNTASGYQALQGNTTGNSNTAFGVATLITNDTGSNLTAIGAGANVTTDGLTNATALGYGANVATSNTIQLGNANVTKVNTSGTITAPKIGVGTNSPNSSAALDVTSTTQGFLPPRMTEAQRTAITSPVAGLVVWCTNCGPKGELQVYNGTEWTNMIGGTSSTRPPVVGDTYGGGVVAYILQLGDPGYNPSEVHGLIAAANDQASSPWGCLSTVTGAIGTALGTGNANSSTITSICTTSGIAAQIAKSYNGGGFSDWYLPSKDELNKLYLNKATIGGFSGTFYWSSTEGISPQNDNYAWGQFFIGNGAGNQQYYDNAYGVKHIQQNVRAVRSF